MVLYTLADLYHVNSSRTESSSCVICRHSCRHIIQRTELVAGYIDSSRTPWASRIVPLFLDSSLRAIYQNGTTILR